MQTGLDTVLIGGLSKQILVPYTESLKTLTNSLWLYYFPLSFWSKEIKQKVYFQQIIPHCKIYSWSCGGKRVQIIQKYSQVWYFISGDNKWKQQSFT